MIKVLVLRGIPGSGKSTWARAEIAKDPLNWVRVNNDDIRESLNGSVYSKDYENIIKSVRTYIIEEAIKNNKNVIVDNLNISKTCFKDVCKIASRFNKDIIVEEKCFDVDLQTAIERDSKRQGKACVGEDVIKMWWKKNGGKGFSNYYPLTFSQSKKAIIAPQANSSIDNAIIVDLDGTLALIGNRSPYDAANCHLDLPNAPVVKTVQLYYENGYKVLFCSGRQRKDEEPTRKFIEKHFHGKYELFMRETKDQRSDDIVKEEIYVNNIKDKYNVFLVIDDRLSVCRKWFELGLPLFRVGDPDADF
jgi:predicted kinase